MIYDTFGIRNNRNLSLFIPPADYGFFVIKTGNYSFSCVLNFSFHYLFPVIFLDADSPNTNLKRTRLFKDFSKYGSRNFKSHPVSVILDRNKIRNISTKCFKENLGISVRTSVKSDVLRTELFEIILNNIL